MCEQWDYYRRYNFSGTVLRALASPWGFSTRRRLSMGSYGTHMLIHLPNGHITYEIDSPLICSSLIWTCWVYKCQEKVIKIPHHETIQLRHCCAGQNYMDEKNRQRRNNGWFMNVIHMWDKTTSQRRAMFPLQRKSHAFSSSLTRTWKYHVISMQWAETHTHTRRVRKI